MMYNKKEHEEVFGLFSPHWYRILPTVRPYVKNLEGELVILRSVFSDYTVMTMPYHYHIFNHNVLCSLRCRHE